MTVGGVVLLSAWLGICAVWVGFLVAQFRLKRDGLVLARLSPDRTDSAERWPTVCVVIPVRNEAAGIAQCIDRVLDQDYPSLSVRIVDDRSEDDTLNVVRRLSESDPRISVTRIESLPEGWLGKSHALWTGTRDVDADWLLFVDADCTLDPQAVRTTVSEATTRSVDLLSLWPRQAKGGFWEHMLIPLCGGIIAMWFGSSRVNRDDSNVAFANGQFVLIKRDTYERINGHRSVRRAIIEDIPLAERAKRCGARCWVASGRELVAVRMYDGCRAILDGWARIYVGALRSGIKIVLGILWLASGSLWPFVGAIWFAANGWDQHENGPAFVAVCALHLSLIYVVSFRFWAMGDCPRRYLLLYPISVVVVMGILARAWWWLVVRRRITWRGTSYAINSRGEIEPAARSSSTA